MAKRFKGSIHLPLTESMLAQLRVAADVLECSIAATIRGMLFEGLKRMEAGMPKPEKIELTDYPFHGVRLGDLDSMRSLASRTEVDWMMDLELCIINPQGVCMQLEQNWKGKHDWTANPYEGFYLLGGRYLKEDSPTMLAERERASVDWDRRRKYNSGLSDPHAADVARQDVYDAQPRPRAALALLTTGTVVLPRTADQPDTPPKSLEQLLSDD